MLYFLKKVAHYFTSNSTHGTHSPFVYALAEELIYNKDFERSDSLISDIINFYSLKGIGQDRFLITDFKNHSVEQLVQLQDQYFMIFVENIYRDARQEDCWRTMKSSSSFVVLIDLFEFGIVCKRKEQPKENFKLRYPYFRY